MSRTTIGASLAAVVALVAAVLVLAGPAGAASSRVGFGFNAPSISGFRDAGEVFLTGGGSFDPESVAAASESDDVHSAGGFRCLRDVNQGRLSGCLEGQGVRWDSEKLLRSTGFKCTGAATEPPKTAVTGEHTVVIQADFARAGDGNDESLHAKLIVSDHDLAEDIDGVQNIWIEQVGCGSANVNFNGSPHS